MNEFRVEQQPVTPANFLICVHVCACACTSGLLCLLSASSKCVFSMLTCTCSRGDTLGPHTLYTRVGQSWEGRSSPPRLISVSVCICWECAFGIDLSVHMSIFPTLQLHTCVDLPMGRKERNKGREANKQKERGGRILGHRENKNVRKNARRRRSAPSGRVLSLAFPILPHQLKPPFTAPVALSS